MIPVANQAFQKVKVYWLTMNRKGGKPRFYDWKPEKRPQQQTDKNTEIKFPRSTLNEAAKK